MSSVGGLADGSPELALDLIRNAAHRRRLLNPRHCTAELVPVMVQINASSRVSDLGQLECHVADGVEFGK